MELRRYLLLLRQRMALIVVSVVAGVVGGYIAGRHTPIYQAQTSIYVAFPQPASQSSTDIIQMDQMLATYAALVKSVPVAEGAVQASHVSRPVGQVISETSSAVVSNTNLISVTVADRNPGVARSLADGVAASFIAQVQTLSTATGAGAVSTPSLSVFQHASLPAAPLATSRKRDLALGAFLGLAASIGLVLLVDYLDITVKSVEDLESHSDLALLGTIGSRRRNGGRPFTGRRPTGDRSAPDDIGPVGAFNAAGGGRSESEEPHLLEEAYRVVRANLSAILTDVERPRVMVTSANAGEGKTVICANLAVSFARAGQRVVVVDLNLRRPDIYRLLGAHNDFGVRDVLLGQRSLEACVQRLPLPSPDPQSATEIGFLSSGPPVPNPTELLGSGRAAALLDQLGRQADLILIDGPAALPVADILVIGRTVSGVVLVVEARRTTFTDLTKTADLLVRSQTRTLGVVLNKLRPRPGAVVYRTTVAPGERDGPPRDALEERRGAAPTDRVSRSGRSR